MAIVPFPSGFTPTREGLQEQTSYRVKKAEFGDGYCQRSPAGINTKEQTLNLRFIVDQSGKNTLVSYFDTLQGVHLCGFDWQGVTGAYSIESFSLQQQGVYWEVLFQLKLEYVPYNPVGGLSAKYITTGVAGML